MYISLSAIMRFIVYVGIIIVFSSNDLVESIAMAICVMLYGVLEYDDGYVKATKFAIEIVRRTL